MKTQLAEALGDEVTVEKLPAAAPTRQTESWLVQVGADRFVVTTGDGRFSEDDIYVRQRLQNAALIEAMDNHLGWMTVTAFANGWGDDSQIIPTCRMAMALQKDDLLAAFFKFNQKMTDDFEQLQALLEDMPTLKKLRDIGESTYLYRDDGSDDADDADDRSMRRRLKEFVDQFKSRQPDDEFAVQIDLHAGFARESRWIQVNDLRPNTYAGWQFIGEFTTDSILYPEMQAGEPVVIGSYEITNWRYTHDGKQTLGQNPK